MPKDKGTMNERRKEEDDSILSDSDTSMPDIECDTCGLSFSNAKSYASHVQGKKHQKKVSEAKFLAKNSTLAAKENENDSDEEDSKQIRCEVCDKYISGYMPYAAHLKGSVHAKNVKKQKLKQELGNRPEVLDKEEKESGSEDEECLGKPYARCSVCQKEFSGPEPFDLHVKSAAHKKKVKEDQTMQSVKEKYNKGVENSDDDDFFSKCDICQKSFSGLKPYAIHMKSPVHKKNVEKKKVAEEMKKLCLNDDVTAGYVCKECRKTFSDPLAFKSHLENNSHEKQKAKEALAQFLASHPEIVFVTPLDKGDSGGSDADDSDSKYYLICKICHMSFSGPESAQDHVKSKKHAGAKMEKKMRKLLKQQEVRPSAEISGKDGSVTGAKSPPNEISANGKVTDLNNLEDFELL